MDVSISQLLQGVSVKRLLVVSVAMFLAVAGFLLWRQGDADMGDADSLVAKSRGSVRDPGSVATTIGSPESLQGSPEAREVPARLGPQDQRQRLNRFFLERYYPDLEKEAGFNHDDIDRLIRLKGSDEADLERGLGATKYQHWKDYEIRVLSEDVVRKLGRNLPGDDQLSEDQAALLHRTVFDERRWRDEQLRARAYAASIDLRMRVDFEFGNLEIREESDRRLLATAGSFLTWQQLAALPEAVIDPNMATQREQMERLRAR